LAAVNAAHLRTFVSRPTYDFAGDGDYSRKAVALLAYRLNGTHENVTPLVAAASGAHY
jgi:hypothetical protein